ncbi:MAG: hypothetical protein ACYC57_11235 [Thermoleophilia bacterium]
MIDSSIYFEDKLDANSLVSCLKRLPDAIRPVYYAEDERRIIKENVLSDTECFQAFLNDNPLGFILHAPKGVEYGVNIWNGRLSSVSLYLSAESNLELVVDFISALIELGPVFGYACEGDEYDHRNRHYMTIGINHMESWVGRDLDKYISGVYWHTLLTDELLSRHSVKLADLTSEAISCEVLGDGSYHLLKFFEYPYDWKQNAKRLDDLCERVDGVFSMRPLESELSGTDFTHPFDPDLNKILKDWK